MGRREEGGGGRKKEREREGRRERRWKGVDRITCRNRNSLSTK